MKQRVACVKGKSKRVCRPRADHVACQSWPVSVSLDFSTLVRHANESFFRREVIVHRIIMDKETSKYFGTIAFGCEGWCVCQKWSPCFSQRMQSTGYVRGQFFIIFHIQIFLFLSERKMCTNLIMCGLPAE
jgi:hypothetical protein